MRIMDLDNPETLVPWSLPGTVRQQFEAAQVAIKKEHKRQKFEDEVKDVRPENKSLTTAGGKQQSFLKQSQKKSPASVEADWRDTIHDRRDPKVTSWEYKSLL